MSEEILGTVNITNTMALHVLEIEFGIDDYVVYRYSNEVKNRKAKLYTTIKDARSYFKIRGQRHYLDEIVRRTI